MKKFAFITLVLSGLFLYSCYDDSVYNDIIMEDYLRLGLYDFATGDTLSSVPVADGHTLIKIAAMAPDGGLANKNLTFKSSTGVFVTGVVSESNTLISTSNDTLAFAILRVGQVDGLHQISMSHDGDSNTFNASLLLALDKAFPDSLFISASTYELDTTKTTSDLEVFLFRESGKCSEGVSLSFGARQDDGSGNLVNVGRFSGIPVVSDLSGKVEGVAFLTDTRKPNNQNPILISVVAENGVKGTIEFSTSSL